MFSIGDLVVYGGEGVCRVDGVGPASVPGAQRDKLYYRLSPLGRSGQVLTPVDTRVLIRAVMSAGEARSLVARLGELPPEEPPSSGGMRAVKEHCRAVVLSYDCERMARLIKAVYRKRRLAADHGKKVSQLEERCLKRAEEQFYGELSAALGMERAALEEYIRRACPDWPA